MSASARFVEAAAVLAGDIAASAADPATLRFLASIGMSPSGNSGDTTAHHVLMLRQAAKLDRFFRLDSPFAPRAFLCGGMDAGSQDRPAGSYSGRGVDLGQAFLSCVGEAAEHTAMYRSEADPRVAVHGGIETVAGRSLVSGATVQIAADRCLRRGPAGSAWPSSTGFAAGPTLDRAIESGFLECVERDAIARWYAGETIAMHVASADADRPAQAALGRTAARPVILAALPVEDGLAHVVVATSRNDRLGTAFGFGAAFSREDARQKAMLELCQGEIGLLMIEKKRQGHGDAALSGKEVLAMERAAFYRDGRDLLALTDPTASHATAADLANAVSNLAAAGRDVVMCDLTLAHCRVPVARVHVSGCRDAANQPRIGNRPQLL